MPSWFRKHVRPRLTLWKQPWKRDIGLLLLSAVWFVICIYAVALANAFSDRQNTNENLPPAQRYVAPDPLMDATNPWFLRSGLPAGISDTLVGIAAALLIAFALTRGAACVTIVRRALLIIGSLYLGRTPYMTLTTIPAPWRYCFTTIDPNFGADSWELFDGHRVDCGDTFYSGHTLIFMSCILLYWYHCRHFWITVPVTLFALFGMVSLVFSGYHYTIDVIGAAVFTFLCWWLFHLAVEVDEIGNKRWWGRLIRWFDNNGHEVLEDREGHKKLMMAATGRGEKTVGGETYGDGTEGGLPTIHTTQPVMAQQEGVLGRRKSEIIELPRFQEGGGGPSDSSGHLRP
ncbi:sphingomyelin synthase [Thoreauomyces humboldtii]|nr:sphingomyelin synthase [Thoreauomyces humboldtii]